MAVVDLSLKAIFQHRFRAGSSPNDSWEATVEGNGSIQNGGTSAARFDYLCNNDGGGAFTEDRIYLSFDMTGIPADATISAVSLLLYTDDLFQNITDSDYMKSRIVKSTVDATAPNGATTGNAHDVSVNNGSDVTVSQTDDAENEFDFGSSNLYDYVVAQHAAGGVAAFYHMSKLVFDELVAGDGSATDPSGQNRNNFDGDTGTNPPKLRVTFTVPDKVYTEFKILGGTTKVLSGNIKINKN
tara:strand:- start:71 stop:796 length:726 start_codon:yes stop_codon:yes gene_type:complete